MNIEKLQQTAQGMVAPGRGILAMDESTPTCSKRFDKLGIPCTEDRRRSYRDMLVTTPGLGDYISGAILFDETLRQSTLGGTPFAEYLQAQGIIPGIKVDAGAKALAGHGKEKVTEGLDGLRERLAEYATMGARFAKWRAVITIGAGMPSAACSMANAHGLARYAALCQEADMVPIVEPEVLIDGDHTIERCFEVTRDVQQMVFAQLTDQGVAMSGIILRPSMVIAGKDCAQQSTVQQVAEQTVRCLRETVPADVPGIAFLSGGQGDEEATAHLNAMNRLGEKMPWAVTFSYGRALQAAAMEAWSGKSENVARAQRVTLHRARMNGAAASGEYASEMEQQVA